MGSQLNFALLNCSQPLPSGKNIWERFKLKKDWRPSVFVTSPWGKPKQVAPSNMKDMTTFRKYVENAISARAVEVGSDKDFARECSAASAADNETCIVVLKGTKYTSAHVTIEENLVKQFPKIKVVSIDAVKHRLSFEKPEKSPASGFSLKIHAIRKGGYYYSMSGPPGWESVEEFVTQAIALGLDEYKGHGDVKVVAAPSKGFKKRGPPPMPPVNPEAAQRNAEPIRTEEAQKVV